VTRPIDLTPAQARAKAMRRATARRWAFGYVAAAGLCISCVGVARLRTVALQRELASLERKTASVGEQIIAVAEIANELDAIATSLELHQRLAPRPGVGDLLRHVAAATPPSTSLTSLVIDQRQNMRPGSARAARRAGETEPKELLTQVHIGGVARDDADVVRLMSALDKTGVFSSTSLEYSRPFSVGGIDSREFRVAAFAPVLLSLTDPEKATDAR
jgi:Tfp pilus assembly protein PilN